MNTNRRNMTSPGTGIASLLLIAVILCLTAFGVLAFVSARADLKLTEANARTVGAYYTARGDSQKLLSQLDGLLQESPGDLTAALTLQPEAEHTQNTVTYAFSLSDAMELQLTVSLAPSGSAHYTVLSEQIVESGTREEGALNLWNGK